MARSTTLLPSDDDLVQRLRSGDEQAFALLLKAWTPRMLRVGRSFVSTDASAMEVVQDTWLSVVKGLSGFEGRASLRTWVYRILVNTAKSRAERGARVIPWGLTAVDASTRTVDPARFQDADEPYPGHWREFPAPWPSPEDAGVASEIRTVLATAVMRLPPAQRAVITLRDIDGCSSAEVCDILDITPVNQRVLLHQGRAALRSMLERYFNSAAH
jgi:RNA polymerase sigma-70 factor (ECF subfamily)